MFSRFFNFNSEKNGTSDSSAIRNTFKLMPRPPTNHSAQGETYVHQNLPMFIQKTMFYLNFLDDNGSYDFVMFVCEQTNKKVSHK